MLWTLLTSEHSPISFHTVIGLCVVLLAFYALLRTASSYLDTKFPVIFCSMRWLWSKAFPSLDTAVVTNPKTSPLVFYRVVGRLVGLASTYMIRDAFRVIGDPTKEMMGSWMLLAARMISSILGAAFAVHVVGFLEDVMVLTILEPNEIGNGHLVGSCGKLVRASQHFIWAVLTLILWPNEEEGYFSGLVRASQNFIWQRRALILWPNEVEGPFSGLVRAAEHFVWGRLAIFLGTPEEDGAGEEDEIWANADTTRLNFN